MNDQAKAVSDLLDKYDLLKKLLLEAREWLCGYDQSKDRDWLIDRIDVATDDDVGVFDVHGARRENYANGQLQILDKAMFDAGPLPEIVCPSHGKVGSRDGFCPDCKHGRAA